MPDTMRAMMLNAAGQPLQLVELPIPEINRGQVLVRVHACGVCRTDLHIVDGELPNPSLPLIPGHEIVGEVAACGKGVDQLKIGTRVGIPWLGWTCGECRYCRSDRENLCERARFTGYTLPGGYAQYTAADARYCFPIPDSFDALQAAPLMCAGLIGYRSYRFIGEGVEHLGIYGFGAAGHIVAQIAAHQGKQFYAFTRPGDKEAQDFARNLGAAWAGDSTATPPRMLDATIIFAPVGYLIPAALRAVAKGGVVVAGGIHMSDIPAFPYQILWDERVVRSVANLTRQDGQEFLALAAQTPIRVTTESYELEQANLALKDLREGHVKGAVVLEVR